MNGIGNFVLIHRPGGKYGDKTASAVSSSVNALDVDTKQKLAKAASVVADSLV